MQQHHRKIGAGIASLAPGDLGLLRKLHQLLGKTGLQQLLFQRQQILVHDKAQRLILARGCSGG